MIRATVSRQIVNKIGVSGQVFHVKFFSVRESQKSFIFFGTAYVRCFGSGYLYPYQKKDKCCGGIGSIGVINSAADIPALAYR